MMDRGLDYRLEGPIKDMKPELEYRLEDNTRD